MLLSELIQRNYLITYIAEDSSGNKTQKNRRVTVLSSSQPEITLLGNDPLSIIVGSTYIDAGAIATYSMRVRVRDAVGNIRTGGNVSAKTLATITKTYALSSSQTYRGSAGSKYTKYATELMQGTYDSTLASTRNTLMIFPHATIRTDTA